MKKLLGLLTTVLILGGCGSNMISPMSTGSTARSNKAILIGKIILDPAVNDDGDKITSKSDDDFLETDIGVTRRDAVSVAKYAKNKDESKDGELYLYYGEMKTNEFFALPSDPQNKYSISTINFKIERRPWNIFKNDVDYYTGIHSTDIDLNQNFEAGKAYYIGTIRVKLAPKSFTETGDQEYHETEINWVVPQSITTEDEYEKANAWAKKNIKGVKNLIRVNPELKSSGDKNRYDAIVFQD